MSVLLPSRLPWWKLAVITSFAFSTGLVSNTLEPAVIGQRAIELVPENLRNTAVGLTTFAGLMLAIGVQPVIGALSDSTGSRWGRRRPYLVAGTLITIASLYAVALAGALSTIAVGVLLLYLGMNLTQIPGQALVPDHVPAAQHGRAAGLKALFELLAFVVGRFVSGELVAQGDTGAAVTVPAVLFAVTLGAVLLTVPDRPAPPGRVRPVAESLRLAFKADLRRHPVFGWWFANRILFWCGFIALQTFLLFFIIDVVGLAPTNAYQFVGRLSTVIGLAVLLVTLPAGWLTDQIGRRGMIILAGVLATISSGAFLFARQPAHIGAAGLVFGLGVGIFLSANWALVTDIVPVNEAARYLGLANIASAAGSAIGRLLGGVLIDPLNATLNSNSAGYIAVYGIACMLFAASVVVAWRMPLAKFSRTG